MNSSSNPLIRPGNPFQRRIIALIESSKPRLGVGVFERPLPGGVSQTFRTRAQRTDIHPFYLFRTGKFHAGTVNGRIPTLDADPIGEDGNAIEMSASKYVYIRNTWSLTFGSANFLTAASLTTTEIITSESPLTDELGSGATAFRSYRLVAQIIDGRVQRMQQTTTNLLNAVCDQSDGTSGGKNVNASWNIA